MRVLYVAPHLAVPPIGGPELRTWNSIRALAVAKDVSLLIVAPKDADSLTRTAIEGVGARLVNPRSTRLRRTFSRQRASLVDSVVRAARRQNSDAIWWSFASLHAHAIEEVRLRLPGVAIVADSDSVWSRFVGRGVVASTSDSHRDDIMKDANKAELSERILMQNADVVTAVSDVDAEYYRGLSGSAQVKVFSNVIHLADFGETVLPINLRDDAISVSGSFYAEHSPMVHGTKWLLEDVMPTVWSMNPNIVVRVIGRGSSDYFDVDDPRVDILGQVENIHQEIVRTRAALVPLFFESGTRFKILEAAALGTPVVSTSLGVEGLNLLNESAIYVADSAEEFARRIISVLENRDQSIRMARNALRIVQSEYSLEVAAKQAREVLTTLAGDSN